MMDLVDAIPEHIVAMVSTTAGMAQMREIVRFKYTKILLLSPLLSYCSKKTMSRRFVVFNLL